MGFHTHLSIRPDAMRQSVGRRIPQAEDSDGRRFPDPKILMAEDSLRFHTHLELLQLCHVHSSKTEAEAEVEAAKKSVNVLGLSSTPFAAT
jgi:hypothetical protein